MNKMYVKPQYSRKVKLILTAVLAALVIVLCVIIALQAKQARAERAGESAAQQQLAAAEQQQAEQQAALKAAEEQAQAERAAQAEAERLARAEEAAKYSFYQKLAKGYDAKMLIMGDSIIDGTGASGDGSTWYALLKKHIEDNYLSATGAELTVENAAGAGHTLFPDLMSVKDGELAAECDLAVLCYGHEDPQLDFALYYEALVRAIHDKNPDCAVIFVLEATEGGHSERMVNVEEVCKHYSIPVADTFAPFYALGQKDFFSAFADAIHPNDKGQQIFFETVRDIVDENVAADTGKPETLAPLKSASALFDNLEYLPASAFTRADDTSYTLAADGSIVSPCALMLDCAFPVTRDSAKVIADDILYTLPRGDAIHDGINGNRYLFTVNKELIMKSSMSVVFTGKDYADGFNGAYFMWANEE